MPSPFPGIDPYLEASGVWPDFHARVITYCCDALNDLLPEHYLARIDERFGLVEVPYESERLVRPDVAVLSQGPSPQAPAARGAGAVALEPVIIPLPAFWAEVRETRVEILHRSDFQLVTAVEILSPANKVEPGHSEYLAKRNALFRRRVNLVELDLLVGGRRLPMGRPLPPGDYYAIVARGRNLPDCEVFSWSVRQPIPSLPVPLRHPDPDVRIDLAAVIASAYDRGRYARFLDYGAPMALPLSPEDRAWAEGVAHAGR